MTVVWVSDSSADIAECVITDLVVCSDTVPRADVALLAVVTAVSTVGIPVNAGAAIGDTDIVGASALINQGYVETPRECVPVAETLARPVAVVANVTPGEEEWTRKPLVGTEEVRTAPVLQRTRGIDGDAKPPVDQAGIADVRELCSGDVAAATVASSIPPLTGLERSTRVWCLFEEAEEARKSPAVGLPRIAEADEPVLIVGLAPSIRHSFSRCFILSSR